MLRILGLWRKWLTEITMEKYLLFGAFYAITKLNELKSNATHTPNVYGFVIFLLKTYNFGGSIPSGCDSGREASLTFLYFWQGS